MGDYGAYVHMQLDLSPCLSHVTLQDTGCSAVWFRITVSFFGSPRVSAVFPSPSLLSDHHYRDHHYRTLAVQLG